MLVGSTMECWNQLACHTALVARRQKWHQTSIETDGTPSHSIKENLKRGKRLKKKQIALIIKKTAQHQKTSKLEYEGRPFKVLGTRMPEQTKKEVLLS